MKSSSLCNPPLVRLLIILSLLGAIALPVSRAQVSFAIPSTYAGFGPLFEAGFNGDGKPDLMGSNGALQLGNRDGGFASGTVELAQSGPARLANQANGLSVASELQLGAPQVSQGTTVERGQSGPSRRRHVKSQVQNGPEQVLYSFQGGNDGSSPSSGLIFDSSGNLYGTTEDGGEGTNCSGDYPGCGTVFELSPNGSGGWAETILYSFLGGSDGALPSSGLIFDQAGNLYGTTRAGGPNGGGTVFELGPNGSGGWAETVLYSFDSYFEDANFPQGLIFDQKGNLYGTTEGGGGHAVAHSTRAALSLSSAPTGAEVGQKLPFMFFRIATVSGIQTPVSFSIRPETSMAQPQRRVELGVSKGAGVGRSLSSVPAEAVVGRKRYSTLFRVADMVARQTAS